MPATEVDLRGLVEGKRVAVVGNAPEVLDLDYGQIIEHHDLVVRFNKGLPSSHQMEVAIGRRTDILVGGIIGHPSTIPVTPKAVLWTKHTRLGDEHLNEILAYKPWKGVLVWQIPRGVKEPHERWVGRGISSAIATIAALSVLDAKECNLFGVSCWGVLEPGSQRHWWVHEEKYRVLESVLVHDPKREAEWIRQRFTRRGPLYWTNG